MSTGRSLHDKALVAFAQGRVRVLKASSSGIALSVTNSRPDPDTLQRATYRALLYRRDGQLHRECDCPAPKRCYHLELCELLVSLGDTEGSHR